MTTSNTIRISHLLFDFLGWVDYPLHQNWPKAQTGTLRLAFVEAIWNNDVAVLQEFCTKVMRLQDYRYQLNGTAGVETKEWIPQGLEQQFRTIRFDAESPVTQISKTPLNQHDPGIILQQCLFSEDVQKILSIRLSLMNDEHFIYFSEMIDALEWFSDFQSQFFFTYHPEAIPKELHHHFWFIDEHYLGEKLFTHHES